MTKTIDHFGFAVRSIEKAMGYFVEQGFKVSSELFFDPLQSVALQFYEKDGFKVELIEPSANAKHLDKFIKNEINFYHIGYVTFDMEADIKMLEKQGFLLISPPKPAIAFEYRKVCFLCNSSKNIIELIENANFQK